MEIWKDIDGYEGSYKISNKGFVMSVPRRRGKRTVAGGMVKYMLSKDGYPRVVLSKNCNRQTFCIHRIVATHFIQNIDSKPTVNHKDGNKLNNSFENLEWSTQQEQIAHSVKMGMQTGRPKKYL